MTPDFLLVEERLRETRKFKTSYSLRAAILVNVEFQKFQNIDQKYLSFSWHFRVLSNRRNGSSTMLYLFCKLLQTCKKSRGITHVTLWLIILNGWEIVAFWIDSWTMSEQLVPIIADVMPPYLCILFYFVLKAFESTYVTLSDALGTVWKCMGNNSF